MESGSLYMRLVYAFLPHKRVIAFVHAPRIISACLDYHFPLLGKGPFVGKEGEGLGVGPIVIPYMEKARYVALHCIVSGGTTQQTRLLGQATYG